MSKEITSGGELPTDLQQLKALALAATPGPWARSARPVGPFWHISSGHTVGGKPCLSGRQAIGSAHAASKKDAPEYATMFQANADFIAAANPAVVLDLIARIETEKQKRQTAQGMADCMDMVRQEFIEAGVIDASVPPMMLTNAVLDHFNRIERAAAPTDAPAAFAKRYAELLCENERLKKELRLVTPVHQTQGAEEEQARKDRADAIRYRFLVEQGGSQSAAAPVSGDELPRPDCTYADHSYPAYSAKLVRKIRDEARAAVSASQAAPTKQETMLGPWPTVEMTVAGKRILEKKSPEQIQKYSAGIANAVYEAMCEASPIAEPVASQAAPVVGDLPSIEADPTFAALLEEYDDAAGMSQIACARRAMIAHIDGKIRAAVAAAKLPTVNNDLIAEAAKLAPILRNMCEGGDVHGDGVDIYADDYMAGDGDTYVVRAAVLLESLAASPSPAGPAADQVRDQEVK